MNERRFPKGKEWDDIVENAFSSTDTHSFSAAYRQQREILQKGQTMNRKDDINTPESRRERTIIKSTGSRRNVKAIAAAISVIAAAAVIIRAKVENLLSFAKTSILFTLSEQSIL